MVAGDRDHWQVKAVVLTEMDLDKHRTAGYGAKK